MGKTTWCPQCGSGVAVDEDGCCATCGATATGPGANAALAAEARVAALAREVEALREVEAITRRWKARRALVGVSPAVEHDGPSFADWLDLIDALARLDAARKEGK